LAEGGQLERRGQVSRATRKRIARASRSGALGIDEIALQETSEGGKSYGSRLQQHARPDRRQAMAKILRPELTFGEKSRKPFANDFRLARPYAA
jgi:hypothetical protein